MCVSGRISSFALSRVRTLLSPTSVSPGLAWATFVDCAPARKRVKFTLVLSHWGTILGMLLCYLAVFFKCELCRVRKMKEVQRGF